MILSFCLNFIITINYIAFLFILIFTQPRSSRLQVFCKVGVLTNFIEKPLCQSYSFNKVAGLYPITLLKKTIQHRYFFVNLVKFFGCLRDLRYASEIYRHTTGLVVEIATVFKNTLFRMYSAWRKKFKTWRFKKKIGTKVYYREDRSSFFICL